MRSSRLVVPVACLVLAACSQPPAPVDSGGAGGDAGSDAGHDASTSAADTGADAGPPVDAATMCAIDFAGCTTLEDHTADTMVTIDVVMPTAATYAYSPSCIRIAAGTMVTIANSAFHPLMSATCSPADSPIATSSSTATTFTFASAGNYGYFCGNHGAPDGQFMAGLIVVQ